MISLIIPCYNEEESIPYFIKEINKVIDLMKKEKFELIFVDDGSKDKTLEILEKLADEDKKVKYISFSRNFGKEAAMLAGLKNSKGDYVAVMDVDLQDPPTMLIDMYNGIKEGYDCVGLRRTTRVGEPKVRSFFATCYYKLINKISTTDIVDGARDFRLMTRQMVDSILELEENNRYSKGIFSWVGYKTKWLEYKNVESKKIIIEKHVIVGTTSVILPGAILREGASCGAFSLIKEEVLPWTINVGIPIKKINDRKKYSFALK